MGSWSDRTSVWGPKSGGSGKERLKTEHSGSAGGGGPSKSVSSSPHSSKPSTPTTLDQFNNESEPEREVKNTISKSTVSREPKKQQQHQFHIQTNRPASDNTQPSTSQSVDHDTPDCGTPPSSGYRGRRGSYYGSRALPGFVSAPRRPGKPSHRGRRDSDGSLHGNTGDPIDPSRDTSVEMGPAHIRPQPNRGRRGGVPIPLGGGHGVHGSDNDSLHHRSSHR